MLIHTFLQLIVMCLNLRLSLSTEVILFVLFSSVVLEGIRLSLPASGG